MRIATGVAVVALVGILLLGIILIVCLAARKKDKKVNPDGASAVSGFDGNTWQLIGYRFLATLLTGITLGIAFPWTFCMLTHWETKHTIINGRRLQFTGRGIQLLGKYLLWAFLTVITLGIYGFWFGLNLKKWVVKHTVYADGDSDTESWFSGGIGGYIGTRLLAGLLTVVTFGIGAAWGTKRILSWEAKHTHIGGSPLVFSGTGGQLFVKYLLLALLTPLTLGIYALCFPVRYMKWLYCHTDAVYQTAPIQAKSKEHQTTAAQDYARFHLAANDTELTILKSGMNGSETQPQLEELAEAGNPYAQYQLAACLKANADTYEGQALQLLKQAADAGYHQALFDYALIVQAQDPTATQTLLEKAAQQGNSKAPWLLQKYYQTQSTPDALFQQAYWYRLAMEWNDPDALQDQEEYLHLVKKIALLLSEKNTQTEKTSALPVVLGITAGIIVLLIGVAVLGFFKITSKPMQSFRGDEQEFGNRPSETTEWLTGSWCALIEDGYTGMMVKYVSFYPDNTFSSVTATYSEAMEEEAEVKAYNKYWQVTGGGVSEGTYSIEGDTVTFFRPANLQYPEDTTWTWDISIQQDTFTATTDTGEAHFIRGSEPDFEQTNTGTQTVVGTWRTVYRDGTSLRTDEVILRADGTCEHFGQEFYHADFVPMEGESGWYVKPVGWPTELGTYILDGSTLTLSVVDDYGGERSVVYEVGNIENDTLQLNGIPYLSSEAYPGLDMWEMCEILNVNTGTN